MVDPSRHRITPAPPDTKRPAVMIPADLAGTIVSHRNDRMGGRIIAMLNAMRIARDYDLPFRVGWTTGGRTSEEVRDPAMIFDAAWVGTHFFDSDVLG